MRIKYRVRWDSATRSYCYDWDTIGESYQHAANMARYGRENVRVLTVRMKPKALPEGIRVRRSGCFVTYREEKHDLDLRWPCDVAKRIARAILRAAKEAEKGVKG